MHITGPFTSIRREEQGNSQALPAPMQKMIIPGSVQLPAGQGQLSATRGQGGRVTHRHSLEAKHSRHQEHPRIFAGKASFPVHVWKAKGTRPVQASAATE